jgi:uncharacterized LabA/DUF88 family protein
MGLHTQRTYPVAYLPEPSLKLATANDRTKFSNLTTVVKSRSRTASAVIVDSPNATRSALHAFGPRAKPDWTAVLELGSRQGRLAERIAAVNDGLPKYAAERFRRLGYSVHFSHARDVDDCVVYQVVRMVDRADVFVIVSGDGAYCNLVRILRRLRKRVIVVAVERCCSRILSALHCQTDDEARQQ